MIIGTFCLCFIVIAMSFTGDIIVCGVLFVDFCPYFVSFAIH